MKYLFLLCSFLSFGLHIQAQTKYWVFLGDKGPNALQKLQTPTDFLSQEALEIRKHKNIPITIYDLPVDQTYVSSIKSSGVEIISQSRWLNALAVKMTATQVGAVADLEFVTGIHAIKSLKYILKEDNSSTSNHSKHTSDSEDVFNYGESGLQNAMINIAALHNKGYTGKGIRIAVLDAGFDAVDTLDVFDSLRAQKRIIAAYDFVEKNDTSLFREDKHGMQVLSTIVANLPGEMVGTAPHASVLLARTENSRSETQQEEHNWVSAVEWADSIGVDVIHTSLGYHDFDNDDEDYKYEDMDGNTAIITRAADMAAARGILVTTSAGNEGSYGWGYITAPCDGDSILCIGSVNKNGRYSSFSSRGPTADGRIKPDIVAMGSRSVVASPRNYITNSDGTSFAAPIVAGMVACIRQAHPDRSITDIFQAIRLSGNRFTEPDEKYGYGIPDAGFADSLLSNVKDLSTVVIEPKEIKPPKESSEVVFTENPQSTLKLAEGVLNVTCEGMIDEVYIMYGKQRLIFDDADHKIGLRQATFNTKYLLKGDYYLYIKTDQYEERIKFSF